MDVSATLNNIGNAAKLAASELTFASAEIKKLALINAAEFLWSSHSEILSQILKIWFQHKRKICQLQC